MIWFGYVLIFYLFNFIFFVCYMLSYEITEWFKVTLLYSMTWINLVFTTIHFLLNILLLIFFYIILLFISHSLPKKVIVLSLSLINSFLQLYFRLIFFFFFFFCVSTFGWYTLVVCFLSYLSHVFSIPLIVLVWVNF